MKREHYPWMFDVTKCAVQEAIIDLGAAFRGFFEKRGQYPRFKKKGSCDRFCAANETGTFRTHGKRIKLPVIGWVRMREVVRSEGALKRATISREADRWFVSITIDAPDVAVPLPQQEVVGVDLGVRTLATPSCGEPITGPKAHSALLKRLRRISDRRTALRGERRDGCIRRVRHRAAADAADPTKGLEGHPRREGVAGPRIPVVPVR